MEIYPKCLLERQSSYFISFLRLLKNFWNCSFDASYIKMASLSFSSDKKKCLDGASKFSKGSEINIDVKYFSLI